MEEVGSRGHRSWAWGQLVSIHLEMKELLQPFVPKCPHYLWPLSRPVPRAWTAP